jgi:hypothetical protein
VLQLPHAFPRPCAGLALGRGRDAQTIADPLPVLRPALPGMGPGARPAERADGNAPDLENVFAPRSLRPLDFCRARPTEWACCVLSTIALPIP